MASLPQVRMGCPSRYEKQPAKETAKLKESIGSITAVVMALAVVISFITTFSSIFSKDTIIFNPLIQVLFGFLLTMVLIIIAATNKKNQ